MFTIEDSKNTLNVFRDQYGFSSSQVFNKDNYKIIRKVLESVSFKV